MRTAEAQGREQEVDAKQQQQAQRWHIAKIAIVVVAALGALGIAAVCGVKNVSIWKEVSQKVFDLKSRSCMPRLDLIRDMYKPEVKYMRPAALKKLSGKNRTTWRSLPSLEEMLEKMTVDDHIGQIIQPEERNTGCWEMRDSKAGAIFFAGDNSPGSDDATSWLETTHQKQQEALNAAPHHLPVLIGVDTIHGMSHMNGATMFPHNIGLGCMRNEKLMEQVGRITALEATAVGVNWGFSPCVAVATDLRWGRIYESFGQDPHMVGKMGAAYVRGANSVRTETGSAFITTGKHFVGDGGTTFGTGRSGHPLDRGDTKITLSKLKEIHLKPYEYLVEAGLKSVMASFSSINGELMHGHGSLINGELKGRMGFKGFVSSDYAAVNALDGNYDAALTKAINAGVDQVMLAPHEFPGPGELANVLRNAVKDGRITEERIKDAARRVMWAKYESGLMDKPHVDKGSDKSVVGCAKHVAVARQVVAESVVIMKNEQSILPFNIKEHRVCVVGTAAQDKGMQLGGWTLDWQGNGNGVNNVVTVWDGVSEYAKENGMEDRVSFSQTGDCQGSDIALVVVGEYPYAEFMGDRDSVPQGSDSNLVHKIKEELNMPIVLLSIGGRPFDIDKEDKVASGVAVAFVPGTEGGHGITDVLFGKTTPKGKLSVDWPKSGYSIAREGQPTDYLYKYDHGLTWGGLFSFKTEGTSIKKVDL